MKWVLCPEITKEAQLALNDFSAIKAQLLFNKGVTDAKQATAFFAPEANAIYDPGLLPNISAAADEILRAVKAQEKIFIYGDYDVDGVSATAIMFDFLYRGLKAKALPYIPDRFEEGYGLGEKGLDHILEQGGKLLISVDCGIKDADLVAKYSAKGLRFIITDHHTIPETEKGKKIWPKKAIAVVHPGLKPGYPFPQICATAVAWKLVTYTAKMAVKTKLLTGKVDTTKYLDLVALATVCDIMPMQGENRALVSAGLQQVKNGKANPGLKELISSAQIEVSEFDSYHFGFIIGPRLNAAGRIEHALDGVRLLTGNNKEQIVAITARLNELNQRRQRLTQSILEQSLAAAEEQVARGEQLIFVYGENWSEGVVGLVASKLNEKFYKPVLVANFNAKEGTVKGSARSIQGFDITAAIAQSRELLLKFGGHNQAAGFTLKVDQLENFIAELQTLAKASITDELAEHKLLLDAKLGHENISNELVEFIEKMRPFGYGNREPLFWFENMKVWGQPKLLGKEHKHLKFTALTSDNRFIDVLGFNLGEKIATITANKAYDFAGILSINSWNGIRSLQIKLKDFRPV